MIAEAGPILEPAVALVDVDRICQPGCGLMLRRRADGSWAANFGNTNPRKRKRTILIYGKDLSDLLINLEKAIHANSL